MMATSFPDIKIGLGSGNKIKLSSYIQPDNTPNINTNSYQLSTAVSCFVTKSLLCWIIPTNIEWTEPATNEPNPGTNTTQPFIISTEFGTLLWH